MYYIILNQVFLALIKFHNENLLNGVLYALRLHFYCYLVALPLMYSLRDTLLFVLYQFAVFMSINIFILTQFFFVSLSYIVAKLPLCIRNCRVLPFFP